MREGDMDIKDAYEFLKEYEKFIFEFWGSRCPDYEPDCHCCKAWRRYEQELAAVNYAAAS